jgi:hypothetical protein
MTEGIDRPAWGPEVPGIEPSIPVQRPGDQEGRPGGARSPRARRKEAPRPERSTDDTDVPADPPHQVDILAWRFDVRV